ncbi:MAG: S1C family serine protease [Planctomycetota bacterium]|nr:S1C family serine protease [Planctomycetota bacterium]
MTFAYLKSNLLFGVVLVSAAVLSLGWTAMSHGQGLVETIADAKTKMCKIYGAGGFSGLEDYQTGILISDNGHVLTSWSHVLDSDVIAVVLDDGRRFEARYVGHDPRVEIAILKIDAEAVSYFNLDETTNASPGDVILALTNLYGVATGNEPVSVQLGTVTAVSPLDGERVGGRLPYKGPVYVVDAMTSNPGTAGGALIDRAGKLIAVVGKDLKRGNQNIWMNYGMPIKAMQQSIDDILSGKLIAGSLDQDRQPPGEPMTLELLGFSLVPDVVGKTPPFIDRLIPQGSASATNLRKDDLILFVNDKLVASCSHVEAELSWIHRDDPVTLTVQRGQEIITVDLETR